MRFRMWVFFMFPFTGIAQPTAQEQTLSDSLKQVVESNVSDSIKVSAAAMWRDLVNRNDPAFALVINEKITTLCNRNLQPETTEPTYRYFCENLADALYFQGKVLASEDQLEPALELFKRCDTLYTKSGNSPGRAIALNEYALTLVELNQYAMAVETYSTALVIAEKNQSPDLAATILSNLSTVFQYQGNYAQALECLLRSITLENETGNKRGLAATLGNIGIIYRIQGDFNQAIYYYTQSLDLYNELSYKKGAGIALNNMGNVFKDQGNYEKSIELYQQSIAIKEMEGDKRGIATSLANIASVYGMQGDFENAIAYYTRSLKMREEIGNKVLIAFAKIGLGAALLDVHNYAAAKEHILYAWEVGATTGNHTLLKRSTVLLYEMSRATHQLNAAYTYLHLLKAETEKELNVNYFTLSEHEKELYFSTMEGDFGMYYDFAVNHHDSFPGLADSIYNMALRNKGLTLKSSTAMRSAVLNSGDTSLVETYRQWIQLRHKISAQYANGADTKELELISNEFEKELVKKSAAFNDFEKIKSLNWKDVRDHLRPGECAVEFLHFKSTIDTTKPIIYAALVVHPESEHPAVVKLCSESEIIQQFGTIQNNNQRLVERIYGTKAVAQTGLYEKIWKPLEPFMGNAKTVFYSPSGLLHKVAFPAICKSQNVTLSDLYKFRHTGSTGNLVSDIPVAPDQNSSFLIMGGVNYSSDSSEKEIWSYLPGSLDETDAIAHFLTQKHHSVTYFSADQAREEIFKEQITSSDFIHIATHGFFFPDPDQVKAEMTAHIESGKELTFRGQTNYANWSFINNKNPLMRSGIVLANANDVWSRNPLDEGEDGIVTAQEVASLDLRNTKLVVLSACETGLGDIKGSEGVFGLQRAFKMAGARYLIMSLWQVPDKETAEFMTLFYKNLVKEKDIPIAFQKTQKVMRQTYDPYYWGAFVLIE